MGSLEWSSILIPILIFAVLGLLAGLLLSIFSKIFAVKTDERVDRVMAVLPGVNCGACGYSGCEDYAKHVVNEGAATNRCIPGGDKVSREISDILGASFQDVAEQKAFVACGGKVPNATSDSYIYRGEPTCAACNMFYDGKGVCNYGCIGYGDCQKQCAFDAISIIDEVAVINPHRCTGCTMCTKACPKHIIHMRDAAKPVFVTCSNCDTGRATVQVCQNGCIACKKCEKTCPHDAIHVTNNLASIDYDKCTACMECVKVCPRRCIVASNFAEEEAEGA